ncbi:MAG: YggS family pyridoxal phosphate-dependent enzyme [Terriglobia bacterium]
MSIRENIDRVEERIRAACARGGRRREDIRLIAVSKTFSAGNVREAYEAGLRDFGENRVQEAAAKIPELADLDATWHLIGHLQTNKARRAYELFGWIHAVDSFHLAEKLDQEARRKGNRLPILLEVNLGGEESKYGIGERDVREVGEKVALLPGLALRGLMLIPPFFADSREARPFFRRLRELAADLASSGLSGLSELSMGMSHDFEVAIEEGATMIRVGTAIFGARRTG